LNDVVFSFELNGRPCTVGVPPRMTLADLLRDRLGQTGTHLGCEHGACGACTVLVDGASVRSCLMLGVQASGRSVTTIEGVSPAEGPLSDLQQALSDHGGLQCGFCTPGVVLAATELLERNPSADEEAIRSALSGNLCRCTGYEVIVRAVLSQTGGPPPPPPSWNGDGPDADVLELSRPRRGSDQPAPTRADDRDGAPATAATAGRHEAVRPRLGVTVTALVVVALILRFVQRACHRRRAR
jgi:aerobic carbon-monoxide dehydrogenase small subunit